jgi:MerR family transcriptional regulator, redox-sensitive transcriptional activator SoxR
MAEEYLTIGETAARSGLAASALRFYEDRQLITSTRTEGNQRRYRRDILRRLAFIQAAQRVGLSLDDIRGALATLPEHRAPTARQWERLASTWKPLLDERIRLLESLRDDLNACIGCGCLSLEICRMFNPADEASATGAGPRYLPGFGLEQYLEDYEQADP